MGKLIPEIYLENLKVSWSIRQLQMQAVQKDGSKREKLYYSEQL